MQFLPDASSSNWVNRILPSYLHVWAQLLRLDRPIGFWLLILPCWWGVFAVPMASIPQKLYFAVLLTVGAFVMRSAGCIVNDIFDRDIDKLVQRTANRPLAAGVILPWQAWSIAIILCFIGLLILLLLPWRAFYIGLVASIFLPIYPLMKRCFIWPQLVLGLAMSWGILVGWSCLMPLTSDINLLFLYCAAVSWVFGYDTIYALQDYLDDEKQNLYSTVLFFGNKSLIAVFVAYCISLCLLFMARDISTLNFLVFLSMIGHFSWQIYKVYKNYSYALEVFRSNYIFGIQVLLFIIL